jgi:hypothetical protein
MSSQIISVNYTTLPRQLLPQAKMHCRVQHDDEDEFLISVIAKAISHFEIKTETKVFEAEYRWTPSVVNATGGANLSPVSPVISFRAYGPPIPPALDPTDISPLYSFETNSITDGTGTYYLVGPASGLQSMKIMTGYASVSAIPPGIVDRILTLTSTYFENRELFIPSGQFLNPLAAAQDLAGWWVPRA